ncbi:MAG: DUF2177 family protein [Betaproteobacteria bacterium]
MSKWLIAYAATVVAVAALDLLWLGVVAKPWYQGALGHLLAAKPNFFAALVFYLVFALGLMVFALAPNAGAHGWTAVLIAAAWFGFFTYATYDLTNLATLRDWPLAITLVDIAWGIVISVLAASAGRLAMNQVG